MSDAIPHDVHNVSDESDDGDALDDQDDTHSVDETEGWGGNSQNVSPDNTATNTSRTSRSTILTEELARLKELRQPHGKGKAAAAARAVSPAKKGKKGAKKGFAAPRQKNWSSSESMCAFMSGTRGSSYKQCATTPSLAHASNEAYALFARDLAARGIWSTAHGGYGAEESIKARTVAPEGSIIILEYVWNRYKGLIKVSVNVIHPLYSRVCPGGDIPSGKDSDWVLGEVSTAYFFTRCPSAEGKVLKGRHGGLDKEPHTYTDSYLDVWRVHGPLGENCPSLRPNAIGERVPGRSAQRLAATQLSASHAL